MPSGTGYRPASPDVLAELVKASGLPFRQNSISWILDCPRCGKTDKLYIRKTDGRFVCWFCKEVDGFQGRPEFALRELTGRPLKEIQAKLYGDEIPQAVSFLDIKLKDFWGENEQADEDASELERVLFPPDFFPIDQVWAKKGREYLEGRGVPLEVAQAYGLRYCPAQMRVIFPVGFQGENYGWQARLITQNEFEAEDGTVSVVPKIVSTKGMKKEQTLMFMDRLLDSRHVVLCEGPFDALKAHQCGGNVATMGKAVSKAQIAILRNLGIQRIYLGLDPDAAPEITRLCRELGDLEVYLLDVPKKYHDLGEMPFEEVRQLFDEAKAIHATRAFHFAFHPDRDPNRFLRLRLRRERKNRVRTV